MVATVNPLRVRWPEFDAVTLLRGWKTDAERARQLGVSQSTITNLRAGRGGPGRKFITAVINNLGAEAYAVVFEGGTENGAA